MNLSELCLNLILASLLMLLTLGLTETISTHAEQLKQKIELEDNTLKALLILEQNINSSSLNYCSAQTNLKNESNNPSLKYLNLNLPYQVSDKNSNIAHAWQLDISQDKITNNPLIITYQKSKASYIHENILANQSSFSLNHQDNFKAGDLIILDDCNHIILNNIEYIHSNLNTSTITLRNTPHIDLKAPIMIGTINIYGFYIGSKNLSESNKALFRYDAIYGKPALIIKNINNIDLNQKSISISANNHDHNITFKQEF